MLVGSAIGVPGPVATMRPPCTWRLSTAVGGRYNPTLVRSSPASGVTRTRSPTTISFLALSSMSATPRDQAQKRSNADLRSLAMSAAARTPQVRVPENNCSLLYYQLWLDRVDDGT